MNENQKTLSLVPVLPKSDITVNPTPIGLLSYQLLEGGRFPPNPIKTYLGTNLTQFFYLGRSWGPKYHRKFF